MQDLYIYYRVPEASVGVLLPKVQAMQAALGRPCALKRRPDSKDGQQTWMEVYPQAAPGFAEQLAQAVQAAGLLEHIAGQRHVETFIDCGPCA